MNKNIFISLLLLSFSFSFSQEIVSSEPIDLQKNRDVFQIVNKDTNEVTLFLSDKTKVKAIRLNEKMHIVDSISSERPNKKIYTDMIGYNSNSENSRLFWSSNDYEDIITQLYDFTSRKITNQQYSLALKEEKILQKFSDNENFYILSVLKNSNILKLHVFDKNGIYNEKSIPLNDFHFFKSGYKKSDLYGVLGENLLPFEPPFSIQNISTENPTSLTDGAKKRKCYFNKKQIILTIDTNDDYTQVIIVDLENYTGSEKIIKKTSFATAIVNGFAPIINSNSFLIDKKLYQIKLSSDKFYFTIKDLEDNLLKEFSASSENEIGFRNSDFYQEGGDFGGKRILENSSQFIRKINNLNSGLSCYHIGENTLITFGGVSALRQSGGQVGMSQFGLIGALVAATVFNPTMDNFNSYSNRKVVKTEGLFDNEGTHVKGELQPLAFDKIRTFFDNNKDVSSQTLFKMGAYYYLGYYDNKSKDYIIRKFAD